MNRFLACAALLATIGCANSALAAGPAGAWSWVSPLNTAYQNTLKLRLDSEGPTLVGVYIDGATQQEIPIAPARFNFEDGKIAFVIPYDVNGQLVSFEYGGQLIDDAIVGKCRFEINREVRTIDWTAKRKK